MNLAGIENRESRRNNQESSLRFSTRLSILDSREDRESSVNLLLNSTVLMYFLLADADRKLPSKDKGSPCEYAVRFSSYKKKLKELSSYLFHSKRVEKKKWQVPRTWST